MTIKSLEYNHTDASNSPVCYFLATINWALGTNPANEHKLFPEIYTHFVLIAY